MKGKRKGRLDKRAATQPQTPLRSMLRSSSPLHSRVHSGLAALKSGDRNYLAEEIRQQFADSMDLDAAMVSEYPQENRWDYLLGDSESGKVIAVEPHSARTDQISVVISKRRAARVHLREHVIEQREVARWIWVASGNVDFSRMDRAMQRLMLEGIRFVGRQVRRKDLEELDGG